MADGRIVSRYVRVIEKGIQASNKVDETLSKKNRMCDKRWNDDVFARVNAYSVFVRSGI